MIGIYRVESGRVLVFLRGVLQFFLGHFHGILNTSSEYSAQAQSIDTLSEQIGLRGGSVDMSKSQRNTRSGAGRRVSQPMKQQITPDLQDCASMK